MKTIFTFICIILFSCSLSFANEICHINGKKFDSSNSVNIWPIQFKTKAEALTVASGLENGDVFQDQDTKLYQVFYGNVKITGLVVVSFISEQ